MTLERVRYLLAVLLLPTMTAELLFPMVAGSTSLKVALCFILLSIWAGARVRADGWYAVHLVLFSWFVLSAIAQPDWVLGPIIFTDLLNGLQALICVPFLASFLAPTPRLRTFLFDSARLVLVVGLVGAIVGIWKFYLLTQGIMIPAFGSGARYPVGTSLRLDYNVFSMGLVIALSAALWLRVQLESPWWLRWGASLGIPVLAFSVAFTNSRRGLLFLAMVILLQPFFEDRTRKAGLSARRWLIPVATMVLIGVLIVTLATGAAGEWVARASDVLDLTAASVRVQSVEGGGAGLVETRLPLIEYAVDQITSVRTLPDLIFGRGISYLDEMGRFMNREVGYEYPHNFILSALLHGGVFFAGLMGVLVWLPLRTYWRVRATTGWVTVAALLGVVFGLTSSNSLYSADMFYFLLLLAAGGFPGTDPGPNPVADPAGARETGESRGDIAPQGA